MQLQLLLTGNEIMSGDTVDSNSSMIAQALAPAGFSVYRRVTVGDDLALLVEEISQQSQQADVLIINGGLGPTVDDLTAVALAQAAKLRIEEHSGARQHVEDWCERRGFSANKANMKQAMLPQNVSLLANPVGSAVGFALELDGCLVLCTPGVPSELEAMLDVAVLPTLKEKFPDVEHVRTLRYRTFGMGESAAQEMLDEHFEDWPKEIELGFRASLPLLEVKLRAYQAADYDLLAIWDAKLRALFKDFIIGDNDTSLQEALVDTLTERGQTLCCAESCTGGKIASLLTSVSGASQVFHAGIVSYSNAVKHSVLGVSKALLEQHGAVSEAVVLAMAEGALALSGSDYAVAVSGIAGPSGGSDDKPVGTVFIAWGQRDALQARKFFFPFSRDIFQTVTAALAMDLIRRELLGIATEPDYFRRQPKRS